MLWKRHGYNRTPDHKRWSHIKDRVFNPNCMDYPNYGGRGITMYKRWITDAGLFIDYIMLLPNYGVEGYTLDRVSNDYGYEPMNLRWACRVVQRLNQRSTGIVVLQWSLRGTLVARHESIREASKVVGANQSNLGKALRNSRVCKGFRWTRETTE